MNNIKVGDQVTLDNGKWAEVVDKVNGSLYVRDEDGDEFVCGEGNIVAVSSKG